MNNQHIIEIQKRVGTTPDGDFLSKSISATKSYLRSLMPTPNPWPASDQASLQDFYGSPGDESKLVNLDVTDLDLRFEGAKVKTIRVHKKVAESLKRVLVEVSKTNPEVIRIYDGAYFNRPMRNGNSPSLHARGAAIDFCADTNGLYDNWPYKATMPFAVIEAFAREGWLSGGAFWSRDAMHFQATR